MNCLKCGQETPVEQVFCEECLLDMQKHPVKPGTVVLLPRRKETSAPKKAKRRGPSLEEQVHILKKRVRILTILLLLFMLLSAVLATPAIQHLTEDHFKIGQNYTTITTPTTPSAGSDSAE